MAFNHLLQFHSQSCDSALDSLHQSWGVPGLNRLLHAISECWVRPRVQILELANLVPFCFLCSLPGPAMELASSVLLPLLSLVYGSFKGLTGYSLEAKIMASFSSQFDLSAAC